MNIKIFFILLCSLFIQCNSNNDPLNNNTIKLNIQFLQLENDIFKLNNQNFTQHSPLLQNKYGTFLNDYYFNILNLDKDSVKNQLINFIQIYTPIYLESQKKIPDFSIYANQIEDGLKRVHYYFPTYKLPNKIIGFIGLINSFACVLTTDALAIGLQQFLGEDNIYYNTPELELSLPYYIIRTFDKKYITVKALTNIVDDLYPNTNKTNNLITEMVEQGKKIYLLKQFLPQEPDSIIFGFTDVHLKNTIKNETDIWTYFLQNKLLFSNEPGTIRDFIGIGPYCTAISDQLPANLGSFIGYKIVLSWIKKNNKINLENVLKKDNLQLFNESNYKP